MIRSLALASFAFVVSAPAVAQNCPQPVGWAAPERHAAAKVPNFRFALKTDSSHQLQLVPQSEVKLAAANARKAERGKFGGLAALDVARAGTLDVLLSARAYVDLVRNGKALSSVSHAQLKCGGIFKRVSFTVTPGRYTVQLTESEERSIRFATVTKPGK
jgi:hypothetical protein